MAMACVANDAAEDPVDEGRRVIGREIADQVHGLGHGHRVGGQPGQPQEHHPRHRPRAHLADHTDVTLKPGAIALEPAGTRTFELALAVDRDAKPGKRTVKLSIRPTKPTCG